VTAERVTAERVAAESWFLTHGLPAVLRPGALVRRVWPRSAPALAGFAALMANSVLVVLITGKHTIDIDGSPTRTEWFVLATLLLILPLAALVGWRVSLLSQRSRSLASAVSMGVIYAGSVFGGVSAKDSVNLIADTIVIALIFACTATGLGSILGWSLRVTAQNLASVGRLFVRALPVVLLTVLVFFNSYVWVMASTVGRPRLWVALIFLFLVAAAFLVSSTLDRARPILDPEAKKAEDAQTLVGSPFEHMPDRPRRVPLSRSERSNVVFVLALSQIIQVLTVAVVTAVIFFILGLILLSPELLAKWAPDAPMEGSILGMTFPVPDALIQMMMFLAALTFMYVSARAVADAGERARFLDPLIEDLRLTMVARDRYRTYTAAR
jgi:hypothetical protein